jgi:hypothetical protein
MFGKDRAMKKLFLTFLCLFCAFATPVLAGHPVHNLPPIENTHVFVETECTLVGESADGKAYVEIPALFSGNGFFIKDEDTSRNLILATGHEVFCHPQKSEKFLAIVNMINKPMAMSVRDTTVSVIYKGASYPARVLKPVFLVEPTRDFAILEVDLPDAIQPDKFPVLYAGYSIASDVWVYGKVPLNPGNWHPYLIKAMIAGIQDTMILLSDFAYPGLSGSPLIIFVEDKPYVIGIMSQNSYFRDTGVPMKLSWAHRLQAKDLDREEGLFLSP